MPSFSPSGWSYRATQRHALDDSAATDSAVRRTLESNAAALHSAGIRFALSSGGGRPAEFLGNVRKAIAAGLPRDVALQALTVRAAEIAGVSAQLGSVAATYVLEHLGGQSHAYTWSEFQERYAEHFGKLR